MRAIRSPEALTFGLSQVSLSQSRRGQREDGFTFIDSFLKKHAKSSATSGRRSIGCRGLSRYRGEARAGFLLSLKQAVHATPAK